MEVIIGVIVSGLVQFIKQYLPDNEWATLTLVAALSVIGATIYTYFVTAGWWESIAVILTIAGAFYSYIIQRFVK